VSRRRPASFAVLFTAVLFAAVALPGSVATPGGPEIVRAADDDEILTKAASTYEAQPDQGRIRVTIKLTIRNRIPDESTDYACPEQIYDESIGWTTIDKTCTSTTRFFVDESWLLIERAATNLRLTADAGSVSIETDSEAGLFRSLHLGFDRIYRGEDRAVTATYTLPGGAPRSSTTDRVNPAYLNFWALSQPADDATVRIVVPKTFEVDTIGSDISATTKGSDRILASGAIDDPSSYFVGVTGINESGFTRKRLTTDDGREIIVQGWPGDTRWMAAVRGEAAKALPALEALIGQPLPGSGEIRIRETAGSDLGDAYIATFDPDDQLARVSEDYTQDGTVTHELSHAWFNDHLFEARWLSEGYAGWIESASASVPESCVGPVRFPGAGAPALGTWAFASPRATSRELDIIDYQYDAACSIVTQVADQIGLDRMRDVLAALATDDGAYVGIPDARPGAPVTWRDWLDAVDELGMAPAGLDDTHAIADVLRRYGIATTSDVATRTDARISLGELRAAAAEVAGVALLTGAAPGEAGTESGASAGTSPAAASGAWQIPIAVLRPMARWEFRAAESAMIDAAALIDDLRAVEALLPTIAAADSPVRDEFEAAEEAADLAAARGRSAAQLAVAGPVAEAVGAAQAERGPLEELGLLGTDVAALAAAAVAATAAFELAAADSQAASVQALIAGSTTNGLVRLLIAALVLLAVVILAVVVRRLVGRRRIAPAAAGPGVTGSDPADARAPSTRPPADSSPPRSG
jgi:hypothetical protein